MPDMFNTGFSNNAPPPIPGGFGNPTGANTGNNKPAAANSNPGLYPFPVIGSNPTGGSITGPSGNSGIFSATNIGGLSSGIGGTLSPQNGNNFLKELQDAYGKGTGSILDNLITQGLFNPQVAASFLNALQPGINRGESDILQSFGAEGSRFGSAAALGEGDYLSQVNLNEQSTLAGLYEQSINQELGLLTGVLPTLQQGQANRSSGGFWGQLLGDIGSPFAQLFTSPNAGSPSSSSSGLLSSLSNLFKGQSSSSNNGNNSSSDPNFNPFQSASGDFLSGSAGADLGGANVTGDIAALLPLL